MFTPDTFAIRLAALFSDEPDWMASSHWVEHRPSKIRVWIANRDYGLHVEIPGGLNLYNGQRSADRASRKVIWKGFCRWRLARALAALPSTEEGER